MHPTPSRTPVLSCSPSISFLSHFTPPSPGVSHRAPISISFHEVRRRRPAFLAGISLHFASLSSLSFIVLSVRLPGLRTPRGPPLPSHPGPGALEALRARVWHPEAAPTAPTRGRDSNRRYSGPSLGHGVHRTPARGSRHHRSPRRPLSSRLAHADEAVPLYHPGFRLRHRRAPAPTPASDFRFLEPEDGARPRGGSAREGRRERTLPWPPGGPGMRRGRFGGKHGAGRTMRVSVA